MLEVRLNHIRLPAILCSLGSLCLVFLIGTKLFGRMSGALAALIYATLPHAALGGRLAKDDSLDDWVTRLLCAAGGTLRLPFGLRVHLAGVFVQSRVDDGINPQSVLAPRIQGEVPDRFYVLFAANYTHRLGESRLDLGLSVFNPFGAPFREEMGTLAPDGSGFGGELLGSRAMLTARLRY